MDHLTQDIHYALRRLIKSPGFTGVAVLTLALGIGANSAIFSVVNGVLLEPLPYPQADRLVGVYHTSEGGRTVMSGPNYTDVARLATSFENSAAYNTSRMILTGEGDAVRLQAAEVSASLFNVLYVRPALGRSFAADENTPGRTNVAILSHGLWEQRFGGDPAVIGRRVVLDGVPREVVGVMPRGFSYPSGREIWVPLEYDGNFVSRQRGAWFLGVVARLKGGITPGQSAAEVETLGRNLARQYPDANGEIGMTTMPLLEATVGEIRRSVLILLGAVGFVLLIACTNVANLLLARAAARESEMAVRAALGAGRGRLVRQLLTESVVLSLLGAGFGLLLAVWGVELLVSLKPEGIPRLSNVQVDGTVIALVTGVLVGLVPAFTATRGISASLREAGRGAVTSRAGVHVRGLLVIAELALAVMLLAGAGLLMRSFLKLQAVDPGFDSAQALTFELTLSDSRYERDEARIQFFDQLLGRLRALPGVRSASAVMGLPLSGLDFIISFEVSGRPPVPPSQQPAIQVRVATPDYFDAIGIPLERGRGFTEADRIGTPRVVLITAAAARQFFPGEDPIGKTITLGWRRAPGGERAGGEVIGIVGDVKDAALDEPNPPQIYMPLRQWPVSFMTVVMKTSVPPASLADAARAQLAAIDPNLPLSEASTLDAVVARSISQERFYLTLLTAFAGVALALAAIGIFGVLSYAVAQRTREIGIRMALGAQERTVIALIVREAMILVASGVVLGTLAARFLSETMTRMLFSITPADPVTFAAVAGLLMAVALLAAYIPARRATRVDPVVALRAE
ncbi:MAG TPA: ABC transporter permease [Vicinamibacterales bacterium]|nr:ABC transporter permease [Vicinamibacterales bacterium]